MNINPHFIVSDAIISRKGIFILDDIFHQVERQLIEYFFGDKIMLKEFILHKIKVFVELRVVTDTRFYYYVNE